MNQIESAIQDLYANNQSKLYQICNKEIAKFGGISQMEYDNFYSRVGLELAMVSKKYKTSEFIIADNKSAMDYICGVIKLSIWKEMTDKNRLKRQLVVTKEKVNEFGETVIVKEYVPNLSIDAPIEEDGNICLGDSLYADCDIEKEVLNSDDRNIQKFIDGLPKIQRQILEMKMDDVPVSEIKKKLGLSNRSYTEQFERIKSFENIKTIKGLFSTQSKIIENKEEVIMISTQTAEKSKQMQYSIASINKKIENLTIRFDHPLQRESDQWSPSMKGNLVSDILQGNPLPEIVFAEQIINGLPVIFDLDGKQRCTTCYSYANNGFKISRNIRRWNIKYVTQVKDENGKCVLDENGFPTSEYREFDIRGKKFSQLPSELQEKFLDYTFKCDQYLNCDSDEIAYHIIRYNEGKTMNKAQKGITRIGEEFAVLVKSISAMPFFREKGGYKVSEAKNGTLERVVVESMMASKYLDDWKKEQESMCEFLKENAKSEDFDNFEDLVERLEKVINDDVSDMFNSKDSFLWFGLFARFVNTGEDDKKFIEFMAEFTRSLHSEDIDGINYDRLCIDPETGRTRATKDKSVVVSKIDLLEKLMLKYLGNECLDINNISNVSNISKTLENTTQDKTVDKVDVKREIHEFTAKDIIREFVNNDVTDEDVELYELIANDKSDVISNLNSWILSDKNRAAFVALVGYASILDVEDRLDDWLVKYEQSNTYVSDVRQNYLNMVANFKEYLNERKVA